jgi:hypothetical protein
MFTSFHNFNPFSCGPNVFDSDKSFPYKRCIFFLVQQQAVQSAFEHCWFTSRGEG